MSTEMRTDKELMGAYVDASDSSAFEALYGRYHELVYSVCVRRMKQSADAEDAAIAAFMVLQKKASSLRSRESIGGWLYLCAISVCRDALRTMRRHGAREKEVMMLEEVNSQERGQGLEGAIPQIEAEIARLPEYQRNALVLQFYQGMNRKEIATRLGCSEKTVGNWVHRGLETLRTRLSRTCRELSTEDLEGSLGRAGLILPVSYGLGVKFSALMLGKPTIGTIAALAEATIRNMLWTKVKTVVAIAAGAVVVGGAAVAVAQLAGSSAGDEKSAELPRKAAIAAEKPPNTPAAQAAQSEAKAPVPDLAKLPEMVLDESSPDWVIERFVGNASAGGPAISFFGGPALQVGGVGRPSRITIAPDGTAYFSSSGLVKVTPDGIALLVLNATGKVEGPAEEVAAGGPTWSPKDNTLYLSGPNCIRRLLIKPDGTRWVEVVAGTPGKPGQQDGPAKEATIGGFGDPYVTDKGVIYFSDDGIRKLENGTITTVTKAVKGFGAYDEDADIFYYRGPSQSANSFDPKTGKSTRVLGMPEPPDRKGCPNNRYYSNADGPALTHASFNSSGPWLYWDRHHKALWFGGPDEDRARWVKDGWAKTVLTRNQLRLCWHNVLGIDGKGGVYFAAASNPNGIWRAYNKKEVKP